MMGTGWNDDSGMPGLRQPTRLKHSKSYSENKRVQIDSYDHSPELSRRIKLDMGHLKESARSTGKRYPRTEVQSSLKQEILQLEKKLQDQFEIRHALEKALGCRSTSCATPNGTSVPKPATELIKDIAVLELEVVYLEQHLLSLYRKAFDQQLCSLSPLTKDEGTKSPLLAQMKKHPEAPRPDHTSKRENVAIPSNCSLLANSWNDSQGIAVEDKRIDSGVHRCHSSLSQRSAFSNRSPTEDSLAKAVFACHSQPLSMMEFAQTSSNIISLAEHLGTRISDHVPQTTNRLSEDMIKCMSAIYCKLADPPLTNHGLASPSSSLSSTGAFSPRHQFEWSPTFKKDSSFDVRLDNPFHVEGLKDYSGPYSTMFEVQWIYTETHKSGDIEHLLEDFRSLISRLEEVDPMNLQHEEKLAFWINIHNALAMHTYLAYGIPQNNVKRVFLLLKAAYNIGGQTISADTIQSSILRCRIPRPGQWLRLLLSTRTKFKTGDGQQAYAIEHPEPLLHFALCSGSHSDPAVRVYTPKRVIQELETAKEEYVRANFGVRKDHKILLPKVVESFGKELGLCQGGVIEMVQQSLPDSLKKSVKRCQVLGKSHKSIEWVPHNFTFRYLISKDLAR